MLFAFLGLYPHYGHKILTWFKATPFVGWHFRALESTILGVEGILRGSGFSRGLGSGVLPMCTSRNTYVHLYKHMHTYMCALSPNICAYLYIYIYIYISHGIHMHILYIYMYSSFDVRAYSRGQGPEARGV